MNTIILDNLRALSPAEMAELPPAELKEIGEYIIGMTAKIGLVKDQWRNAMARKYKSKIADARFLLSKDTGVIHVDDEGFDITEDRPKRVKWDQGKLESICRRIESGGGNPKEYIDVKYSVSETKYNAWPSETKEAFDDARTLTYGDPTFKIGLKGTGNE